MDKEMPAYGGGVSDLGSLRALSMEKNPMEISLACALCLAFIQRFKVCGVMAVGMVEWN